MEKFFNLSSIAVYGVAASKGNLAAYILKNLREMGFKGGVYGIGSKTSTVIILSRRIIWQEQVFVFYRKQNLMKVNAINLRRLGIYSLAKGKNGSKLQSSCH